MHNLLFFLWMLFYPLVEDIATWVVFKTKGVKMEDKHYGAFETTMQLALYFIVGYLLYESN